MKKPPGSNRPRKSSTGKQLKGKSDGESNPSKVERKPASKKVGPVLVGTPVKPGELEIVATYSAEVSNLGSRREIGLRLSMNKAVLALFIVAGILGFALWRNDRELLRQGLDLLRGIATPHASPQNPDRSQ